MVVIMHESGFIPRLGGSPSCERNGFPRGGTENLNEVVETNSITPTVVSS